MSYYEKVAQWARDRNFPEGATVEQQDVKLFEEFGELCGGIARIPAAEPGSEKHAKLLDQIKDGIGDVMVVMIVQTTIINDPSVWNVQIVSTRRRSTRDLAVALAHHQYERARDILNIWANQYGLTLDQCLAAAWEEIKDRKGKMVDGVFVKEGE
jgi:hypothetical protein